MSEELRPLPAPSLFLASPSQNVPLINLLSLIPGTRVMETMMTGQSTSPLVIWAVAASPEAPPTAVTKVSLRTGPSNRGPGLFMHRDGHRFQKARRGLDGGREVTHAPSLTRVSIKSSEVVSKCWLTHLCPSVQLSVANVCINTLIFTLVFSWRDAVLLFRLSFVIWLIFFLLTNSWDLSNIVWNFHFLQRMETAYSLFSFAQCALWSSLKLLSLCKITLFALLTVFPQRVITFLLYFLSALFLLSVQSRGPPKNHHNNRGPCRRLAAWFSCSPSWPLTSVFPLHAEKRSLPPLIYSLTFSSWFLSVWLSCSRCFVCVFPVSFTQQSCHVHISHQSPAFYSVYLFVCEHDVFSIFRLLVS